MLLPAESPATILVSTVEDRHSPGLASAETLKETPGEDVIDPSRQTGFGSGGLQKVEKHL